MGLSCHPKHSGLHDHGDNETTKNFCSSSRNSNRVDLGFRETIFYPSGHDQGTSLQLLVH